MLDYIYAVLHCPSYREKYKEFLKIDFPKVPYPNDQKSFWTLVALGRQLRGVHLLESTVVENFITQFPISGDNIVLRERVKYTAKAGKAEKAGGGEVGEEIGGEVGAEIGAEVGTVMINETQSFDNVPKVAWEFTIGGYQPAQKWLKERNGRCLSHQDVAHYQKMIVALAQTARLMKEIDAALKV